MYSSWSIWTGGWCFGNRFVIDSAPWVLILSATLLRRHIGTKWLKPLIVGLLVLGFAINLPGAFNYALIGWCAETNVADVWSLRRSQLYCAWREMLGVENEQLLVHLKAELSYDENGQPWVKIFYWNPTRSKRVTLFAGVSALETSHPEKLYKIYELGSYHLERGASGTATLPVGNWLDDCPYRETRVYFLLTQDNLKRASNLAMVQPVKRALYRN